MQIHGDKPKPMTIKMHWKGYSCSAAGTPTPTSNAKMTTMKTGKKIILPALLAFGPLVQFLLLQQQKQVAAFTLKDLLSRRAKGRRGAGKSEATPSSVISRGPISLRQSQSTSRTSRRSKTTGVAARASGIRRSARARLEPDGEDRDRARMISLSTEIKDHSHRQEGEQEVELEQGQLTEVEEAEVGALEVLSSHLDEDQGHAHETPTSGSSSFSALIAGRNRKHAEDHAVKRRSSQPQQPDEQPRVEEDSVDDAAAENLRVTGIDYEQQALELQVPSTFTEESERTQEGLLQRKVEKIGLKNSEAHYLASRQQHQHEETRGRASAVSSDATAADILAHVEENVRDLRNQIITDVAVQCSSDPGDKYMTNEMDLNSKLKDLDSSGCTNSVGCFPFKGVYVNYEKVGVQNQAQTVAQSQRKNSCLQRGIADIFLRESNTGNSLRSRITNSNENEDNADLGFASVVLEPPRLTRTKVTTKSEQAVVRWPLSSYVPGDMTKTSWHQRALTRGITKNVLLVLDRSYSMHGNGSWEPAKTAAKRVLQSLEDTDRFFLMTFQHPVQFSAFEFVHATEDHIKAAEEWLDSILTPNGGAPDSGTDVRPDAEFGIGAAIVVGTLGFVPHAWRQQILGSTGGNAKQYRIQVNDDYPPHRIDLPGMPVNANEARGACWPSTPTENCERTFVFVMTDEDFSRSQFESDYSKWLSESLLNVQNFSVANLAKLRLDIYQLDSNVGSGDLTDSAYTTIADKFNGIAERVPRNGEALGRRMVKVWRDLIKASDSDQVVWSSHDPPHQSEYNYELVACTTLTLWDDTADMLHGSVCVDIRAALDVNLDRLNCYTNHFRDSVTGKIMRAPCNGNAGQEATVRAETCQQLSAKLSDAQWFQVKVTDILQGGENELAWETNYFFPEDAALISELEVTRRLGEVGNVGEFWGSSLLSALQYAVLVIPCEGDPDRMCEKWDFPDHLIQDSDGRWVRQFRTTILWGNEFDCAKLIHPWTPRPQGNVDVVPAVPMYFYKRGKQWPKIHPAPDANTLSIPDKATVVTPIPGKGNQAHQYYWVDPNDHSGTHTLTGRSEDDEPDGLDYGMCTVLQASAGAGGEYWGLRTSMYPTEKLQHSAVVEHYVSPVLPPVSVCPVSCKCYNGEVDADEQEQTCTGDGKQNCLAAGCFDGYKHRIDWPTSGERVCFPACDAGEESVSCPVSTGDADPYYVRDENTRNGYCTQVTDPLKALAVGAMTNADSDAYKKCQDSCCIQVCKKPLDATLQMLQFSRDLTNNLPDWETFLKRPEMRPGAATGDSPFVFPDGGVACNSNYNTAETPGFYCPLAGVPAVLVGCGKECVCNNGEDADASTCEGHGKQNCKENGCYAGYKYKDNWPTQGQRGCFPSCVDDAGSEFSCQSSASSAADPHYIWAGESSYCADIPSQSPLTLALAANGMASEISETYQKCRDSCCIQGCKAPSSSSETMKKIDVPETFAWEPYLIRDEMKPTGSTDGAMTLVGITCKPEYDQVSQPKFYCPGGGQEVSLVGCDQSCECNNGQLDRAPNTCTVSGDYGGNQNCLVTGCNSGYKHRTEWPSAGSRGCYPACDVDGFHVACPLPETASDPYWIPKESVSGDRGLCAISTDEEALAENGMQPEHDTYKQCQQSCCTQGCARPSSATERMIEIAAPASGGDPWEDFLTSSQMQPGMTADSARDLQVQGGNVTCAAGFVGTPKYFCQNAGSPVSMTGCSQKVMEVTTTTTTSTTTTVTNATEAVVGGGLNAPAVAGGCGALALLLLLALVLCVCGCGSTVGAEEEEVKDRDWVTAQWGYSSDIDEEPLDEAEEDIKKALVAAGLSAGYADKLTKKLLGSDPKSKRLKAPSDDKDSRAMRDLGFDFDLGDVEVGVVRGIFRKALAKRRKKDIQAALTDAGASSEYAAEVAKQVTGWKKKKKVKKPSRPEDLRAMEQLGVDFGGPVEFAALRQLLQSAVTKGGRKTPLGREALLDYRDECASAEAALLAAGLSPAGARRVAQYIAGPFVDTEPVPADLSDVDKEALSAFVGGEVLMIGAVREVLRQAERKKRGGAGKDLHGGLDLFDFSAVETALLDAGLSRGFSKKMAAQITDRGARDDDPLVSTDDAADLEVLRKLGLDLAKGETVGHMRGFLDAFAHHHDDDGGLGGDLSALTLDELQFRLETAGFSQKMSLFVAKKMHKKAKAGQSVDLTEDEIREIELQCEETFDVERFRGITEKASTVVGFQKGGVARKGKKINLQRALSSPKLVESAWKKIKRKKAKHARKSDKAGVASDVSTASEEAAAIGARASNVKKPKKEKTKWQNELEEEAAAALEEVGFSKKQAFYLAEKIAATDADTVTPEFMKLTDEERRIACKGLGGIAVVDLEGLVDELVEQKADFFTKTLSPESYGEINKSQEMGQPGSVFHSRVHKSSKKKVHHNKKPHPKSGAPGADRKSKRSVVHIKSNTTAASALSSGAFFDHKDAGKPSTLTSGGEVSEPSSHGRKAKSSRMKSKQSEAGSSEGDSGSSSHPGSEKGHHKAKKKHPKSGHGHPKSKPH